MFTELNLPKDTLEGINMSDARTHSHGVFDGGLLGVYIGKKPIQRQVNQTTDWAYLLVFCLYYFCLCLLLAQITNN